MTEIDTRAALYCAAEVLRRRRRTGEPIPQWLRQHFVQLESAARQSEHESTEIGDAGAQSNQPDLIGCREAAGILQRSRQQVARTAALLGGWRVGGSWVFNRNDIVEIVRGRHDG